MGDEAAGFRRSEEEILRAKINLRRRDIQLLNEFGMSQLIPTVVEELTNYQKQYYELTGKTYQRPLRVREVPHGTRSGMTFWKNIRSRCELSSLVGSDRVILDELCGQLGWMGKIPSGLLMSFSYLYQCVRGVGSEDSQIIER